jgi:hypothetical protein
VSWSPRASASVAAAMNANGTMETHVNHSVLQPASAGITYPWCAEYGGRDGGGRNCGFWTYQQYMATILGNGGYCETNAMYRGPQPGMIPPPPGPPRRYGY